jgi:hypothetical protein
MRRLWLALVLSACTASTAAVAPVGGAEPDPTPAEEADDASGGKDAGPASDAAPHGPDDILGTLTSGACGVVKTQITSPSPSLENNLLVFVAGEKYVRAELSPGGQKLFDAPNAGGSSGESEVMAFEVLRHCEGATLVKTETEIDYQLPDDSGPNTITDILVSIAGSKVGVSVTRVYKPGGMTDPEVKTTLEKKLEGIKRSSQRVLPHDKWVKQILHVFSPNKAATDAVARVYPTIPAATRADTITFVTETKGGGFVYCNPDPPLGSECP